MQKAIPKNHQAVMPYLIVENANAFIDFLKDVFDGLELNRHMRTKTTIMHAEVSINESILMMADSTPEYPSRTAGMLTYVDDADARYHKALGNGVTIIMPPADQSYGRSCGVYDSFGNTW